jgi:predicted Zn-dependent peptidase
MNFALALGSVAAAIVAAGMTDVTASTAAASQPAITAAEGGNRLRVPVDYYKLPNGLKVVLSRDTTSPTACAAVYYNIGSRNEPKDRTGFAHLFEHMMFQGSANLGKMAFIRLVESNGGILNGSTRFDFTNYLPGGAFARARAILWAEADRMRSLDIDIENLKNQQEVVKNEVKSTCSTTVWRLPVDRFADVGQ